jgi:hypothetical protein
MKQRIVLLTTLAAMLVAAMALSGVAQAKPTIGTKADAKCLAEAAKTLQPGFKPADYTFHGGTEGNDNFTPLATDQVPEVFCGFGGDDVIATLVAGDIFLGGAGGDSVGVNIGTVYGGEGIDRVQINDGTVYGGEGNDRVDSNNGTFYGGPGDDRVITNFGTFDGGDGTDTVSTNVPGNILINVP